MSFFRFLICKNIINFIGVYKDYTALPREYEF